MSVRCFSCLGLINTKCESETTEIECPSRPSGLRVYDSCYTVTRTMDYPIFGRRLEVLKNCTVLAHCSFIGKVLCDNSYNFINSCSIQCCIGDLCNNKTFQYGPSSVTRQSIMSVETRTKVTRSITRATMSNNATRTRELTSGITTTSSVLSIQSTIAYERAVTSWTSAKDQEPTLSSVTPAIEPTVEVRAVSGDATRIYVQLPVLLLMMTLGSGIKCKIL